MCGRFVSKESAEYLAELFHASYRTPKLFVPSHNVAPTESVPIVIEEAGHPRPLSLPSSACP